MPGNARLVGYGANSCSHGEPAAGDGHRWCAFSRPASDDPALTELWVVDVSRVLAGDTLACDGTSSACLRLTDRLFTGSKIESRSHPQAHRFEGDTLFFQANVSPTAKDLDRYEGFIWAWRPGWVRAHALSTDRGVDCRGIETAPVALCVDGVTDQPLAFDLRAGPIADREGPLPLVERIAPLRGNNLAWSATFSPTGETLIYSSWRDGETVEALRTLPIADIGSRPARTVVEYGRSWMLAPGGRRVYFLRGGPPGKDEGDLWTSEIDSGNPAVKLAEGVFMFAPLGHKAIDHGVTFLTGLVGLQGELHVAPHPGRPGSPVTLARDVHAWYALGDGRFTYILQSDDNGERGLIADNQNGTTCLLGSRPNVTVFGAKLLPRIDAVNWTEPHPTDEATKLDFLARPDDCKAVRTLASGLAYMRPVGVHAVVYGLARGAEAATLFYRPVLDDRQLDGAEEPVVSGFDPGLEGDTIGEVGTTPEALVITTADSSPAGKGLFVLGPFAAPGPTPRP